MSALVWLEVALVIVAVLFTVTVCGVFLLGVGLGFFAAHVASSTD
jgi:hypothetical protein